MSTSNFFLILLGIFFIIIEIRIEYSYLQKINVQVQTTKKELQKSINQAQKIIESMEDLMSKSQMPDVLSDIYSNIEINCEQRLNQLFNKFEDFELRIRKLEKKLL